MPRPLKFKIKESVPELKKMLKVQPEHLCNRIRMLLVCKQSRRLLSKKLLADLIGVNSNSIQSWRTLYVAGGMNKLLEFNRGGYKPSLITASAHRAIERKLKASKKPLGNYRELQAWIDERFAPGINYHTVNKYVKRKFGRSPLKKSPAKIQSHSVKKSKRKLGETSSHKKRKMKR